MTPTSSLGALGESHHSGPWPTVTAEQAGELRTRNVAAPLPSWAAHRDQSLHSWCEDPEHTCPPGMVEEARCAEPRGQEGKQILDRLPISPHCAGMRGSLGPGGGGQGREEISRAQA